MKRETLSDIIIATWLLSMLVVGIGGLLILNYALGKENTDLYVPLWIILISLIWSIWGARHFSPKSSNSQNRPEENIKEIVDNAQENMSVN